MCGAKTLSRGTRNEYHSTVSKWEQWGGGVPIEAIQRKEVRAFLDWVYERAVADHCHRPKGQSLLAEYLADDPAAPIFSPRAAVAEKHGRVFTGKHPPSITTPPRTTPR